MCGGRRRNQGRGGETTGGGAITAGDDDLRVFLVVEIQDEGVCLFPKRCLSIPMLQPSLAVANEVNNYK